MRLSASSSFHSTPNRHFWQVRFPVAGFLLLLTVAYFWRQVALGQALYWGDIGLYFAPMTGYLKQNLNAGRLPLWNPLILCGTPYVGNPQVWPLYPVTALLPFVSASQFLNLTIALHVWIAGLGTYAFARRGLSLGVGPALLAAVTFMFGGQLVSKEQFPNMVQASAWLPWVLVCLDSLLRRRRVSDALALGTVLGLQLLAAHVQMTLLTLYLAAAYGLFTGFSPANTTVGTVPRRRPSFLRQARGLAPTGFRTALLLVLALVTASGLALGQLLPTLALFRDAARHHLSFAIVNRFYLPYNQLGNFILPHLHGNPFDGDWTGRGNSWETCCYVGVVSLGLALWGGIAACRNVQFRGGRFWVGVFGVSVWLALGGSGGMYYLAYFVLPGVRSFHDPARCLLPACFALSLLAGFGLEHLPQVTKRSAAAAGIILLAFADLAHFGQTLYPLANPAALSPVSPNTTLVQIDPDILSHQARILAPTNGVWLRFTNYKDFRQTVPRYQALWADTLTPNLMMPYGLSDAFGYEPVALKNTETAAASAAHAFDPKATATERANAAAVSGALGVKYIALVRATPPETVLPGLEAVQTTPTLAPPGQSYGAKASVYLSRDTLWQPRAHLRQSASRVELFDDGPDRVTLTFRTSAPDTLVLEDTQAAGWSAALDGNTVPVATYHSCLRAVAVPKSGLHRLVFTYALTPFRLGLYVSLLTLAGLIGACSFAAARKLGGREGFSTRHAE